MSLQQPQEEDLSPEQEYQLWRKNVPLLYDFVSETKLVWPSLTVQWLPYSKDIPNKRNLLLGTHTSNEEQNYLKIASIELPLQLFNNNDDDTAEEKKVVSNIKVIKKFKHDLEVTRARYNPATPNIVATINGEGNVFIYDVTKDDNTENSIVNTLTFHGDNGYGLTFNPTDGKHLLSGADDGTIALWEINNTKPVWTYKTETETIINDIKWNLNSPEKNFAFVTESSNLSIIDSRSYEPTFNIISEKPFNTIAFSPFSSNLIAAAGEDSLIHLFDIRNSKNEPLHTLRGHEGPVTSLLFHPSDDGILMSAGQDNRVALWDIKQVGMEQNAEELEDGDVSELVMLHAGHRSAINDIDISDDWFSCSVEEDNVVQVWKVGGRIRGTEDIEVDKSVF